MKEKTINSNRMIKVIIIFISIIYALPLISQDKQLFYYKGLLIETPSIRTITNKFNDAIYWMYQIEDYDEALKCLDAYIKDNPSNSLGYYERGQCYNFLQKYDKAIIDYNKVIKIDSLLYEPYFEIGKCNLNIGNYDRAVFYFKKTIYMDTTYMKRIFLKYSENDYHNIHMVNKDDETFNDIYYNSLFLIGICNINLKKQENAIKWFSKVIEPNTNNDFIYQAYMERGFCYYNLKKYNKAISDLTMIVENETNDDLIYETRGLCYFFLKDDEKAVFDFSKAIEINPKNSNAYHNRGISNYYLGKKRSACIDWNKAKELGNEKSIKMLKDFCK